MLVTIAEPNGSLGMPRRRRSRFSVTDRKPSTFSTLFNKKKGIFLNVERVPSRALSLPAFTVPTRSENSSTICSIDFWWQSKSVAPERSISPVTGSFISTWKNTPMSSRR